MVMNCRSPIATKSVSPLVANPIIEAGMNATGSTLYTYSAPVIPLPMSKDRIREREPVTILAGGASWIKPFSVADNNFKRSQLTQFIAFEIDDE